MKELLSLPYEIQIVLFAGYIGYKIATLGRSVVHRTEDFLLQVLAFGTVGRLTVAGILQLVALWPGYSLQSVATPNATLLIVAVGSLAMSIAAASWWRHSLQARWVKLMTSASIYRDDHQASVWASILEEKAAWTFVQLHCEDGRVYEANFDKLPTGLPMGNITLNDDGVAMYITRVYRADDTVEDFEIGVDGYGAILDYFPRSTIKRVEVGWKKMPLSA